MTQRWKDENAARQEIRAMVTDYYAQFLAPQQQHKPGTRIHYSGRVYDEKEVCTLVDSALDFWLTSGRFTAQFEQDFAAYLGVRFASLTNSGSSANLLAFMALTAPELGERAIRRGDEVITVAAAFPTTISPVIQYGAIPVFVDVTIPQYNIDPAQLEAAYSAKTRAVILAHTLGNPFNVKAVRAFCDEHNLWLIEDNCDALGSLYTLNGEERLTGNFGDLATHSFFPAHHITMGEGGCVVTNDPLLHKLVNSYRDWGRDCICQPGQDNRCGRRFSQQYGELPFGYDHKYVYSHLGYNLKATDMQAAIGCEQLKKLPDFVERRRQNWAGLYKRLESLKDRLILPEAAENSSPAWFGFLITLRQSGGLSKDAVVRSIEAQGVQTRSLFGGNLICHPCFDTIRGNQQAYRVIGRLEQTDRIMKDTFWIGVYPGLTEEMLDEMAAAVRLAVS